MDLETLIESDKTLRLYVAGDLHIGANAFQKQAWERLVVQIRKDSDARLLLMGDQLDAITNVDRRYKSSERDRDMLTFDEQYKYFRDSTRPIDRKIVGVHSGNHEDTISKAVEFDVMEDYCDRIGSTYLTDQHLYGVKIGDKTWKMFTAHGIGGGNTLNTIKNKLFKRINMYSEIPDIALVGHWHDLLWKSEAVMDNEGKTYPIWWGITGTFLQTYENGGRNYARDRWYDPKLIGCLRLTFTPDKVDCKYMIDGRDF